MNDPVRALAAVIADYPRLELAPDAHVERWLSQFPDDDPERLAGALVRALEQGYCSRTRTDAFLGAVRDLPPVADGRERGVTFLDLFEVGHSQSLLLEGLRRHEATPPPSSTTFVYLDDVLLSGARASLDLEEWIARDAPDGAEVHLVFMLAFERGLRRAELRVRDAARRARKAVTTTYWIARLVENGAWQPRIDELLVPTDDPSDDRAVLEAALLRAGDQVCAGIRPRREYVRPLGFDVTRDEGFGALVATYRECPNHAPLALWFSPVASDEPAWWPLLPRSSQKQAEERHGMREANFRFPSDTQLRTAELDVRLM